MAVAQDLGLALGEVVTHKLTHTFLKLYPVARFDGCGVAGTLFLLCHLGVELFLVNCHVVLLED